MSVHDVTYNTLLREVLDRGTPRMDRTGTGTIGLFGAQTRYDLREGFPLLTTKRVFWRGVVAELLWFLSGSTNAKWLEDQGVNIWREWGDESRELGPIYGSAWRDFGGLTNVPNSISPLNGVDQISNVLRSIRENPFSRRHIVSAWNPVSVDDAALPPCHTLFQFAVQPDEQGNPATLDCQLYQRSADLFLGVPFNIASYALLLKIMARETGLQAGTFVHTFGDIHIYSNHIEQVREQLSRPTDIPAPDVVLPHIYDTDSVIMDPMKFTPEGFTTIGYNPMPTIKAPVSA